jgi:hypothetical protein
MASPARGWRRHLTYANVMSMLAICMLLAGGTALAAGVRKNSVNSASVRNNSLTSADLANRKGVSGIDVADGSLAEADLGAGSLTGADVANGSLTGAEIANGSLTSADLAGGAIGSAKLAADAVGSDAVVDNSIQGADIGADAITGSRAGAGSVHSIDESTLAPVPDAERLFGRTASGYLSSAFYEERSGRGPGTPQPDGTLLRTVSCKPGDIAISGGANATSNPLIESLREGNTWVARYQFRSGTDFEVRVVCVDIP